MNREWSGLKSDERSSASLCTAQERSAAGEERARSVPARDGMIDSELGHNELLAVFAHELRSPLSAISNALDIWRSQADLNAQKCAQRMLDRQLRKAIRLVDDLMDLSRVKRGVIHTAAATVDLSRVVGDAADGLTHQFSAHRQTLSLDLPPEGVCVLGDATRLEQVVANLLCNSAKFTQDGGRIEVTLVRQARDAVLSVRDNGIGIDPGMLSSIFDLFAQADRAADRTQRGLGIGLTLARGLVESHGGTIEARSSGHNEGSEFIVRLPVLSTAEAGAQHATADS